MPNKIRKYNIIERFGRGHKLGVFNNGVDAIARALTERYFFCKDEAGAGFRNTITPIDGAFKGPHFLEFKEKVMDCMPHMPRLSRQQVVDRYTGHKRRVYDNALLSLQRNSLNKADARLNMFIKYEKQNLEKAPRGINPRSARFNLVLGTYLKHAEKKFFHAINKAYGKHTTHTVIKGLNADESATVLKAKWDRFNEPVAVGLDAAKFDAHVTQDALRYEHSFYTSLFPGDKQLKKMLQWQLVNEGCAYADDGKVEFKIKGTRCSGDLNTSLGNCTIMCGCVYAYSKERGVDVELANNGDDCVVIMEKADLDTFCNGLPEWFRHRGFVMVVEPPVYEFEQIEFCQTRPVKLATGWRMIRNHKTVLEKDTMCLMPIQNSNVYQKWLAAVGECGTTLNSGVPVQHAFYEAYMRHGTTCTEEMKTHIHRNTSMQYRIKDLKTTPHVITPEARVSYYYAFGVLPDEQLLIEQHYKAAVIEPWTEAPIGREYIDSASGIILL